MLDLFRDDDAEKIFDQWVHKEFGRKSGLLPHEYKVIFDSRGDEELHIKGGKTILIAVKYTPLEPKFKQLLRYIFDVYPLRDMLRGANIPRTGGAQWYELSANNVLEDMGKIEMKVIPFTTKFVTSLEMIDKKTKRSVKVEIVGSAFEAQQVAIKLLYGDRIS